MIKRAIADFSARLLRAAISRVITDLEITSQIKSAISSATLIDLKMEGARACSSRNDVMRVVFDTIPSSGFVCELGVYRGQSLNQLARHFSPEKVYGFDTFTGLPEFWRTGFPQGTFDVSTEQLSFEKNCVLYKGLFDETLPVFLEDIEGPAKLIHIDCDLYSSAISALRILAPRIQAGTIIVFDEYFNYPGWELHEHRAFLEFIEFTGLNYRYLVYNKTGQQVAAIVTNDP